ncbi:hypothetical protein M011DRAFT_264346 [Sporormia fimetaria CBS 119925]|uniref:Zn(2)-C6 fungal-type domain-containing protein n=1 Tax=Sporormia fimetaria CBS 119925 TaxID=1340428 RepID=A0A6A6UW71_9PLEO|nr:hypothetical protein M011DRAFT_264346 [Sporormia fimetaria CBS 119925]
MSNMNPSLPPNTSHQKLRNSCDACNTAKVKCSKERPTCRRCERRELFCVYSVSLRSSKRPADQRGAANRARTQSTSNGSPPNQNQNQAGVQLNGGSPLSHLQLDTAMDTAMDTSTDSASMPSSLYDFNSAALSEVNFGMPGLDDYFNLDPTLSLVDLPTSLAEASSLLARQHQQQTAFGGYGNASPAMITPPLAHAALPTVPICGCQQNILSKLSELSLSSSGSGVAVPFDRALSENRAIVALCTSTLDCAACARGNDTMLILTLAALLAHVLVVFKVLFQSRQSPGEIVNISALARQNGDAQYLYGGLDLLSPPPSSAGSVRGPSSKSGLSTRSGSTASISGDLTPPSELRQPVRLRLGEYELDERDEQILQNNLLKIELGKITALVESFESRLGRLGGPSDEGMLQQPKGSNETKLHSDIAGYLRQGLRANYEALKRLATGS